jgi:thioredoxin-related protein
MDLQKVLNRSNVHYPSYKATPELINTIGGVDFTPYTLVTDTEGNFITKLPGYADQEKLIQIINVIRS